MPGTDIAFRSELNASVPAELNSVLAFYRAELGKRGWKESAERAVVKPDQVQLAFVAPDGPAMLKLARSDGETSIDLALKIPAAAPRANIMPKPGQAKLMFGNLGDGEATLTINKQTIRIAPGAGGPQAKGPTLELPPGKYRYSLKVAGEPARAATTIETRGRRRLGPDGCPGRRGDAAARLLRRSAAAARHCPSRGSSSVHVAPQAWSKSRFAGCRNPLAESRFCEGPRIGFRTA